MSLGAETYYVRVNQRKGDTRYRLSVAATSPTPEPVLPQIPGTPGSTLPTALDLEGLSATRTYQDAIGGANQTAKPGNIPIDPGGTLTTAYNLATLTSSLVAHDLVGGIDKQDVYQFTALQAGTLKAELSGLSDTVYLRLIQDLNGNGLIDGDERIAYGLGSPAWNSPIFKPIAAGTYFIKVLSYANFDNTAYTLTVSM